MTSPRLLLFGAALAVALSACVYPATEVTILVDTNLPPTVPLEIRSTVTRGSQPIPANAPADHTWTRAVAMNHGTHFDASVSRDGGPSGDGGIVLPASFAITPPATGSLDDIVTVRIEGFTPYEVLRRTVRFHFTQHAGTVQRIFLAAQCLAPATGCQASTPCTMQAFCEEHSLTCGETGMCVDIMGNPVQDAGAFDGGCVPYCSHAACGAPNGCGGICGAGICATGEACLDGRCQCAAGFSACGASCLPTSGVQCQPDQMTTQACGMCGRQSRTCNVDCTWGAWDACNVQGVCAAGTTRMQPCGNCGSQTAACDATCQWGGFGACTGVGACAPGQTRTQGCGNCGSQSATCDGACNWGGFGACNGQGCAPGSTQQGACGPCAHQTCDGACNWGGCGLNAGATCDWMNGNNSRACGACACGRQYCIPRCVWSTGCVSFCGGRNSGGCFGSCAGGC